MNTFKKVLTWSFPAAYKQKGDYTSKEGAFYLVGMFGQNLIYTIIGAALSMFYSDVVGIDIAIVGYVLLACRVWDAANDPVMGVIMEKTKSPFGKCRPWLKYIPVPIAIVTTLLFLPTGKWEMSAKIAYFVVMYFLWSPAYTMGDIPLWSLPSRMIPDEHKRTKLISLARIVGSIAGVLTAVYAPIKNALGKMDLGIFENVGLANYEGYFSQEQGYFLATLILCVLGAILFKFIFPNVRERVTTYDSKPVTFKESFKMIGKNKPFLRMFLSGVLGCTKTLLLTAGMYFCKWVMGNGYEGIWVIILGAPYLIGTLISIALTPAIGAKITKKKLYIVSSYLSAIPMLILFFVGFQNLDKLHGAGYMSIMLVCLFVYGVMTGFTVALQPIMIADSVDWLEFNRGQRGDGVFASGLTFIAKLTSGIAVLISNALLGTVAYTATINALNEQIKIATDAGTVYSLNFASAYPEITFMMFVLITIVPAIGCVLQALPVHRYEFDDKQLESMRESNSIRRRLVEAETALNFMKEEK